MMIRQASHARVLPTSLLALILVLAMACWVDAEEWHPLFDGKSFDGWEGNLSIFRIEEGAIVGGTHDAAIARNEFLCTEKEFGDFELRMQVKLLGAGANAGIQFRTARIPDHHEVIGYQADMGEQWWGKLYDESRRRKVLAGPDANIDMSKVVKEGEWNDYRIRCQGDHIQLWLNGVKTVDFHEPDDQVARDGVIAVQIHAGPPSEAWYKAIEIRELSP